VSRSCADPETGAARSSADGARTEARLVRPSRPTRLARVRRCAMSDVEVFLGNRGVRLGGDGVHLQRAIALRRNFFLLVNRKAG